MKKGLSTHRKNGKRNYVYFVSKHKPSRGEVSAAWLKLHAISYFETRCSPAALFFSTFFQASFQSCLDEGIRRVVVFL